MVGSTGTGKGLGMFHIMTVAGVRCDTNGISRATFPVQIALGLDSQDVSYVFVGVKTHIDVLSPRPIGSRDFVGDVDGVGG